jgi:CheY-like chemotaxis protein/anti-sigma regulatory factor (Ser/Thr protein kinase)
VEEIRSAGTRASQLVERIVAFSRPRKPSSEVALLPPVVEEVVRLLSSMLPAAVEMHFSHEADTPPVLADPTQIHQVLVNLCTNAWQAMEDKPGCIQIHVERANAAALAALGLATASHVCISVRDSGKGMDAATRERIFEPFFTTKEIGKGTGLGLSVVHSIVKSHRGAISVQSDVGVGSTFRVYLPAAPEGARATEPTPSALVATSMDGIRVLYVDDDDALNRLVQRQLERHGASVRVFRSCFSALDAIRADPNGFDVLVTDFNMPKMSGVGLAGEVRKLRADTPVILTSGSISEDMRSAAEATGIRCFIPKPEGSGALCSAIQRIVRPPS